MAVEATWGIVTAWIHYIAIMSFLACLLGEHLLLKQDMTLGQAKTIQRLDILYGLSATVVLVTGILRMYLEKGFGYYLHHGAFHILVTLFVAIGVLSIYPTVIFLRWRNDTREDRMPQIPPKQFRTLQTIMRVEMALLLVAPLFAAWMAHAEF
jgi:putative membrane protein